MNKAKVNSSAVLSFKVIRDGEVKEVRENIPMEIEKLKADK
jgi:hypothetical protein